VTNITGQPQTLDWGKADFIVTSGVGGAATWESNPRGQSQPAPSITLGPGQSVSQSATWSEISNEGPFAGANVWGEFSVHVAGGPEDLSQEFANSIVFSPVSDAVTASQSGSGTSSGPVTLTDVETDTSDQTITLATSQDGFIVVASGLNNPQGSVTIPATPEGAIPGPLVTLKPGQSFSLTATWNPPPTASGTAAISFWNGWDVYGQASNTLPGNSSNNNPPGGGSSDGSSSGASSGPVSVSVQTSQPSYELGERVRISVVLKNTTNKSIKLTRQASRAIVTIVGNNSAVVWKSSVQSPALKARKLRGGQQVKLSALWNGRADRPGIKALTAGAYTIEVSDGNDHGSTMIELA
jgi:hypothetical protein